MPPSQRKCSAGMLAVDTNVVVRYLTNDDPTQAAVARRLVAGNPVQLLKTVLLEIEWVLRSLYRFSPRKIHAAMYDFARLPRVTVEDAEQVRQALQWFAQGLDFADALHMAAAEGEGCDALATFDRKLAAASRKADAGRIKAL